LNDGGMIRAGYNSELDELRRISKEGNSWIAGEEARFREETGIPKLKVGFNKVFGYYLEVGKAHQDKVPEHFIKKQTLVNADRYFTPELKQMEEKILSAEGRAKALEKTLFEELREKVAAEADAISLNGRSVAALDALYSLSEAAFQGDYVRPVVDDSRALSIEDGRHPVLENLAGRGNFIPNDLELDLDGKHLAIITGPNMAGKSTYMRQAALIAILAQIGSFVPAKAAHIGVIDRIFTRVGATDDLALGQSTFMVEMVEAARILSGATQQSLVILDEIGRGTSTFDGMSLAWAIAEELHNNSDIRCRALFATHYHELTQLSGFLPGVVNLRVDLKEVGGEIVFLHKVKEGEARRSYGIQVAKLAGLPDSVLQRAGEILGQLEKERHLFEIEGKAPEEPETEDEARQEPGSAAEREEREDGGSAQLGLFG